MTSERPLARHDRRRPDRLGVLVALMLSVSTLALPARAAGGLGGATSNASPSKSIEQEPLRHLSETSTGSSQTGSATSPAAGAVGDLSHVVLALAIVISIIFGLRAVARRFSLVPTVGKPGRGVKLLSRTVLAPKQQVLLLQVGRRVVVVGDSGAAGMRPLCEITDANEVAALLGELRSSDASAAGAKSFGSLFRRASEPFDGTEPEAPALAPPPGAGEEVSSDVVGLLDKVRGLRQQFDR